MEQPVPVKEVKILETAEDIQERREQVRTIFDCLKSKYFLKPKPSLRSSTSIWSSKPLPD